MIDSSLTVETTRTHFTNSKKIEARLSLHQSGLVKLGRYVRGVHNSTLLNSACVDRVN